MDNWKIDNSNTLFNAKTCNNRGQITGYSLGNQLTTTRGYNDFGMPTLISTPGIQNLQYDFDILTGNLNSREDVLKGLQEVFTYDPTLKNRLETWKVNTATADTVLYEANGNIDKKSGLGSYTYGSGRPHAVTEIENTGNVVSEIPDTIAYTPFNKVEIIEEGDYRLVFTYGPDNSRKKTDLYKLRNKKWNWQKTKYFVSGGYELEVEGVQQYERHLNYIYGGDGLAAIFEMDRSNPNLYYIHKDHLGSYQSVTNNNGTLVDKYSFGPWGARRDTTDWSLTNVPTEFLFDRGFTGHEHLDEFNLINMNGRVYDPILGRFLSPDNYIQMPDYTQNLNRYSYALNNPLIYTDPTGEFIWPWLAAMAGNYLIGGADRWVNKGMSFNDAFFNKNYVTAGAGVTFSPSNQRFSHPQVTQGIIANQTGLLSQQLDETIASFSGLGRDVGDWFFDHVFVESELRVDYGMQGALEGRFLGGKIFGGYENNTEPLVQLDIGYNSGRYANAYAFDSPRYGYGNINEPIRNGWSAAFLGGKSKSFHSRRGLFTFGEMKSVTKSFLGLNYMVTYRADGGVNGRYFYWEFGGDAALILGGSYSLKIGYKNIYKKSLVSGKLI